MSAQHSQKGPLRSPAGASSLATQARFDKTSGFGVFSLNGAYRINKHWKVSSGVDNLFGKAYAEHLNLAGNAGFGYPANDPQAIKEPGRTLWTKVDMSF